MRLLLINPNTSAAITDLVVDAARRDASPGVEIVGVTAAFGARYIGSRSAAAVAGHAALDAYAAATASGDAYDGAMLACFGDPGLLALRESADIPIAGMAEASCLLACSLGKRFSIITGGERWGPMLRECVASIGLTDRLASVRTVAPSGAEIAANPDAAYAMLAEACNAALRDDGADIIILGGAGLLGIADQIASQVPAPLIDCMRAAIGSLEAMARAKAMKAAAGPFAKPAPVETIGLSAGLRDLLSRDS